MEHTVDLSLAPNHKLPPITEDTTIKFVVPKNEDWKGFWMDVSAFKPTTEGTFSVGDVRYVAEIDATGEVSWFGVGLWDGAFRITHVFAVRDIEGQWVYVDYDDPNVYAQLTELDWTPTHYDTKNFPAFD